MDKIKHIHVCDQKHKHWYEHIIQCHKPYSPHNSKHMFDIYSLTHIFWSLLLITILNKYVDRYTSFIIMSIIVNIFEIIENLPQNIVKYHRIEVDSSGKSEYRGDSTINIIGDIIFNMIGSYLGYTIKDNNIITVILIVLFLSITQVVGLDYWTDFIKYVITTL